MAERTYLELSQDEGVAHKFYEVIVEGTQVQIRYGRIGTNGQKRSYDQASAAKALAFAAKKIKAKKRGGYEPAVQGVRKKRAITRRSIQSRASTISSKSPIIWKFESGKAAFGVCVDDERCWVGNEAGRIFSLSHEGQVQRQYKLPDGVKCIVADEEWLYAGCDNGTVYDLTSKMPMAAYEISEEIDIFWLDIRDGVLGISDRDGQVVTVNHEEESQWSCKSPGRAGWMVRCDEIGVYHGHSKGLTMYDWEDGALIWQQRLPSDVLFGWQEESSIYAGCSNGKVYQFSKSGEAGKVYHVGTAVFSCAASEDGKWVFAGDSRSSIYCFSEEGELAWKMATGCGSAYSMQFHKGRLYIVTTTGALACIDVSEEAISAAQRGEERSFRSIKAPSVTAAAAPVTRLEETSDSAEGVLLHCLKLRGKLKVRVLSEGYNPTWNVQFPRNLRVEGARYVVEEIHEGRRGEFYRSRGWIKKLSS